MFCNVESCNVADAAGIPQQTLYNYHCISPYMKCTSAHVLRVLTTPPYSDTTQSPANQELDVFLVMLAPFTSSLT